MIETTVEREVPVPANLAWTLIADFGDMSWAPGMDDVEVLGEGIGMVRRIHMPGDVPPIDERLEGLDHDNMRMDYTIPRGLPMPLKNYRASAQVISLDEQNCRLEWTCNAEEDGISASEGKEMIRGVYQQLLEWIDAELQRRNS